MDSFHLGLIALFVWMSLDTVTSLPS